ncbi:MAG: hypothetical protein Q4D82_06605 [Neisseria sp.]|nr:hypothetical protein [Neisseria sp.]
MKPIYHWDIVCFTADHEEPDDLRQEIDDWLAANFPLAGRAIPLHAACMAAHACGMEWYITDYRFGRTAILLVQTLHDGSLPAASYAFKPDILRIVAEQSS